MSISDLKSYLLYAAALLIFFPAIPCEATDAFITVLPPDEAPIDSKPEKIKWSLASETTGLKSRLEIFFPRPAAFDLDLNPCWEYRIEIDNRIMLAKGAPPNTETVIENLLSLDEIENGIHTISLISMDFKGQSHRIEKKIKLNTSPKMMVELKDDQGEVLDPEITLSFSGQEKHIGRLEVFLDDIPFSMIDILPGQNNQPLKLSELTGFPIYAADLVPGNHLLSLAALAMNGSKTFRAVALPVSVFLPEIMVHMEGEKFDAVEIRFPKSSNAFKGSAEIRYERSVILTVTSAEPGLLISRDDLEKAIETHNLNIQKTPVSMVISVKSNHVENWQQFIFN